MVGGKTFLMWDEAKKVMRLTCKSLANEIVAGREVAPLSLLNGEIERVCHSNDSGLNTCSYTNIQQIVGAEVSASQFS